LPGGGALSTPIRPQNAKFRTRDACTPSLQQGKTTVASGKAGQQLADGEADDAEFDVRDAAIGLSNASTGRAAKKARARGRGLPPHQLLFDGDAVTGEPEPADCRVDSAGFGEEDAALSESATLAPLGAARSGTDAGVPPQGGSMHNATPPQVPISGKGMACGGAACQVARRVDGCDRTVGANIAARVGDRGEASGALVPMAAVMSSSRDSSGSCVSASVTGGSFRARPPLRRLPGGPTQSGTSGWTASVAWWQPEPRMADDGEKALSKCNRSTLSPPLQTATAVDPALVLAASLDATQAVVAHSIPPRRSTRSRDVRRRRWAAAVQMQAAWR